MLIGYRKVLEDDKSQRKQTRALNKAGCKQVTRVTDTHQLLDLDNLKRGDTLVVWRLDVLASSLKELHALLTQIHNRQLSLHSLSEPFNFHARTGASVVQVLGLASDFQSNLIKRRTLQGLRAARAQGRIGGRPRKLGLGQVKRIRAMLRKPGMTKTRVAKEFGICRVTLNKALERES
jgi:DNA invertase Pin-like site-specific DNA recombinase